MLWNNIKKNIGKKSINSLPLPFQEGQRNPEQIGNRISASAVQSWNPETHPNGRGRSLLVQDIDYDNGTLDVVYNDGFHARYNNISPQQAKDFVQSDSKGRWALKNLWKLPYEEVND